MTSNLTLLYVEDDETIRENFTEIFKSYFKNVIATNNGESALKLYEQNNIDVAILDISIPKINGLNVATKIREVDKKIELIIISAFSDREKLLQAVNLQLFTYLVKPVRHKDLDKVLREVIDKLSENKHVNLIGGYRWDSSLELLSHGDDYIKITKNEIKIISILLESLNIYLKPCEIHEIIYNTNGDKECNNIVQLISRLKRKFIRLGDSNEFFIQSNYGLGYKIITI